MPVFGSTTPVPAAIAGPTRSAHSGTTAASSTRSPSPDLSRYCFNASPSGVAYLRGALWVILSCLCIASMAALVKTLGARLDSFQLAFFRAAFGLLAVAPFALGAGAAALRTRQLGLHLVRGVAGTGSAVLSSPMMRRSGKLAFLRSR